MGGEQGAPSCYPAVNTVDIFDAQRLEFDPSTTLPYAPRKFSRAGTAGGPLNEHAVAAAGWNSPIERGNQCPTTYLYIIIETFPPGPQVYMSLHRYYYSMAYARIGNSDIFSFAGGSDLQGNPLSLVRISFSSRFVLFLSLFYS